jgi:hypothetical protein
VLAHTVVVQGPLTNLIIVEIMKAMILMTIIILTTMTATQIIPTNMIQNDKNVPKIVPMVRSSRDSITRYLVTPYATPYHGTILA